MITEPEIVEWPRADRIADVVGHDDRAEPSGATARRRPWTWALGGAVSACAVWAGVLQGTGHGHAQIPDLYGYHLGGSPCTAQNLRPLTGILPVRGFEAATPSLHSGPALDHAACTLSGSASTSDGWTVTYTVSVTVDLHRTTSPRAEFEDTAHIDASAATVETPGGVLVQPDPTDVTRPLPGLGDKAYFTTGTSRQSLSVLHGGAVVSLTLDATSAWEHGGRLPVHADGFPQHPLLTDTTAERTALPTTLRHLLSVLAS